MEEAHGEEAQPDDRSALRTFASGPPSLRSGGK